MSKSKFEFIESLYLKIFKIVIMVVLTIALFVSIALGIQSLNQLFATPRQPDPAKTAAPPNVGIEKFLDEINKQKEIPKEAEPKQPEPKSTAKEPTADELINEYLPKLYTYSDGFAKACGTSTFAIDVWMEGFPKQVMRGWFQELGKEFAASQDKFESALLSNPRAIQFCKDKKGPLFMPSLDWHAVEWRQQIKAGNEFNNREKARISNFNTQEQMRVLGEQVQAAMSATIAASAFGVFMLLSLLLIFAKIETNLRNAEIQMKPPMV